MTGFRIEALLQAHSRKGFTSGSPLLDRYFAEMVTQDVKRRVSNCFVALDETGVIAGFYTFAAASVPLIDLPPEETKKLPRYPVLPAGLIGRLAIDQRFQRQRLGSALIMDAVKRSANSGPAIFALVVDAKDENAAKFYEHLGFRRFASRVMTLYLPVATALKAFGAM